MDDHQPARCRRGPGCASRDSDRNPTLVDLPGLCDRDTQLLVAALRHLPACHARLGQPDALEPSRGGTGSPSGRTAAEAPVPLQLAPLALADDIHDELTRWEDVVRDRAGMPPAPGRPRSRLLPNRRVQRDAAPVARAAELLGRTIPVLLSVGPLDMIRWSRGTTRAGERLVPTVEDGYIGAGHLINLYRAAEARLGERPDHQHLKGRDCPGCGAETLRLLSADGHVECTTCRDQWDEHEYDLLASVLNGTHTGPSHAPRRVWSSSDDPQAAAS